MRTDSTPAGRRTSPASEPDIGFDPVIEASEESFPASDPPSWNPLAVGRRGDLFPQEAIMTTATTIATTFNLPLSQEEKQFLLTYLEEGLKEKQVEVHRTDNLEFKELVEHEANIMEGLINKLRRS